MHKLGLTLLLTSMVVAPYAALSQESEVPSADDYVCAMTGECPDEATEATDPAQPGSPRVSATRGFSLSRTTPTPTASRPKATPTQSRRQTVARQTARQTIRPVAIQPGRVDLRLAFGPGSSTLTQTAQAQIRAFAEALRRPQLVNVRVRIEGHTDSSGGRAVNMPLSQRRAQAVADYLTAQGVPAERLEVRGFGYDRPLPGRPASASENRRVEAVRIS